MSRNPIFPVTPFKVPAMGLIDRPVQSDGQRGRIRYDGTTWFAQSYRVGLTFSIGQSVSIVARQGNTLLVLPST
ncbi:MAG: NfeD family protein [Cyanobacteria bacterium P01_A01_bin.123]